MIKTIREMEKSEFATWHDEDDDDDDDVFNTMDMLCNMTGDIL